jgi:hypothetical protein
VNVSHLSAELQAKAFADAASYNEDKAHKIKDQLTGRVPIETIGPASVYLQMGSNRIHQRKIREELQNKLMAHSQFAQLCRDECRRLQNITQKRA